MADADIINNQVVLHIKDGEQVVAATYKLKRKNIYDFYANPRTITSQEIAGVFYIDYNLCKLDKQLTSTISKIKQAQSQGITKFIIDVRDNPEGNSEANKELLQALGMVEPEYGIYLRYSPLLAKQWGWKEDRGYIEYPSDAAVAQKIKMLTLWFSLMKTHTVLQCCWP